MLIVISSMKGGVGKSTTAVTLAAALAEHHETLLLDTDAQGHSALALGLDNAPGLFDWLVAGKPLRDCLITARPGLMLMPSDSRTKTVQTVALSEPDGRQRIIDSLRALPFRYVVVDTAAGGLLQEAALAAADAVVIPVRPEHLGRDGLNATLALLERLGANVPVRIVPTAFDKRLNEHEYNVEMLREAHGAMVHPPVPNRVAVAEAIAFGQSVWEYQNRSLADVRAAYSALVCWVYAQEGGPQ